MDVFYVHLKRKLYIKYIIYMHITHKHQMFLFSHFVPKKYEIMFYGVFAKAWDPEEEQRQKIEPLIQSS